MDQETPDDRCLSCYVPLAGPRRVKLKGADNVPECRAGVHELRTCSGNCLSSHLWCHTDDLVWSDSSNI